MAAAASPGTTLLAIGTKKGLWLATSADRTEWTLSGPHFLMNEIPSIGIDTRGGSTRLLVGARSEHFGPTVFHSDDLGGTWTEPDNGAIRFGPGDGAAVERIWQLAPDAADRPGVVWAGCEPISVWKSTDGGEHFELNRGLWEHPDKDRWGAGYGGAAAHSILPSPADPDTVHVAMSTGGVYRSSDGGHTWQARNHGISAYFLPDPNPEVGQCVHKIARDAGDARRLYAQNHHGIYRSDDNADTWVSIADGLPTDFGFVMLAHPHRAGTAWIVPIKADCERIPPDGRLAVHRTDDAGASWLRLDAGLPEHEFNVVLRDAAAVDTAEPAGVYLGTRGGSVYASADEGAHFTEVAAHLPDVLCVRRRAAGPLRTPAEGAPKVDDAEPTVTVVVPGLLAQHTGNRRELPVRLREPATIGQLLDELAREYPVFDRRVRNETGAIRRHVNCFLDGEDIRRLDGTGTRVNPGQEVLIIQSVAGG